MYRGMLARALLSRAAAVAVLCLLLAWLDGALAALEVELTRNMSHNDLKKYISEGANASFAERYVMSLILVLILVTAVEALAAGVRALIPHSGEPAATNLFSETERSPSR